MSEPVKRPYRSPLRERAAADTRRRIREAAAELFTTRGYVATTARDIAAAAEVAPRTVFAVFPGGKLEIVTEALGVAVAGDEEPIAVAERPAFLAAIADPDGVVDALVTFSADLLDRAGPLIMTMVESSGADADLRRLCDEGAEATTTNLRRVAEALGEHGRLTAGVDAAEATDVLVTLCSPHVHTLLRRDRGWSSERYRRWLRAAIHAQLVTG